MDLHIDLGAARNQGQRPTCLAFSLSEIHRVRRGVLDLLSPESLHRLGAQRAKKSPDLALFISEAIAGLDQDGQTTEVAWPYHSEQPVDTNCLYHKILATPSGFDEDEAISALRAGEPIVLVVDIDLAFYGYLAATTLDFDPNQQIQARHAVVICGCRAGPAGPEYLIKNSWGESWGDKGHAWVTLAYIVGRTPELIRI